MQLGFGLNLNITVDGKPRLNACSKTNDYVALASQDTYCDIDK